MEYACQRSSPTPLESKRISKVFANKIPLYLMKGKQFLWQQKLHIVPAPKEIAHATVAAPNVCVIIKKRTKTLTAQGNSHA
jgi:hypothetical protein